MRESMETFVRGPGNAEAVRALKSLSGLRPIPSKLYIEGPRHAGKSTLVRSWAADAERGGAGEAVFAITGPDESMPDLYIRQDGTYRKLAANTITLDPAGTGEMNGTDGTFVVYVQPGTYTVSEKDLPTNTEKITGS